MTKRRRNAERAELRRAEEHFNATYRRPEDTPNFEPDCPICFEPLFNSQGIAEKDKGVAKLKCLHLVHTDCLKAAARALNSDGRRYGFHRFFGPTAGCPICEMPASMWETHYTASSFPIFWMHRIQACLEKIGPAGGLIQIDRVRLMLWDDKSLTKEQKECLRLLPENPGFFEALDKGQNVFVAEHLNGGARNGGTTTYRQRPGCWDWEMRSGTLWMQKWGPTPIPTRATMIDSYEIATVTEERIRANIPIFPTRRSWTMTVLLLASIVVSLYALMWFIIAMTPNTKETIERVAEL